MRQQSTTTPTVRMALRGFQAQLLALTAHLPLLLLMAFVTLALERFHCFEGFDAAMLGVVNSAADAGASTAALARNDDQAEVVSLIFKDDAFDSHFKRRLPLDRGALADVVRQVSEAEPAVLAIDADIAPIDLNDTTSADNHGMQALTSEIARAVASGIPVVAAVYPRGEKAQHDAWIDRLRQEIGPAVARSKNPMANLYLAHSGLSIEGPSPSIIRMPYPWGRQTTRTLAKDVATAEALNLGLAAGLLHYPRAHGDKGVPTALRAEAEARLSASAICPRATHAGSQTPPNTAPPDTPADQERAYLVNYRVPQLRQFDITRYADFSQQPDIWRPILKGKAVIVGVQAFENLDTHLTPVGMVHGASIHAAIAASVGHPLKPHHALGLAVDLGLGVLFLLMNALLVLLAALLACAGLRLTSDGLAGLGPLLALVGALSATTMLAPSLLQSGAWINPVPLLLGLTLHAFMEMRHAGAHDAPGAHGHAEPAHILQWASAFKTQSKAHARMWWGGAGHSVAARVDAGLWWLALVFFVALALCGLASVFHV